MIVHLAPPHYELYPVSVGLKHLYPVTPYFFRSLFPAKK